MTDVQRTRAARSRWQKRLTALWASAWVLAICSRISYRMHWPVPVTATLLAVAIVLAVALLIRRLVAAMRGQRKGNAG
ncbi:hypothetical protein [Arthrobacter sp.]|uniref:hypothetical protein n=1 Tax=Arthrobacter sp. TaxID=1667 RepID=UPI003A95104C